MKSPSYLIVGGTEKSGTTSLYRYLSDHPAVVGSMRKETDYFRRSEQHLTALSRAAYEAHFPAAAGERVRVEASPGYLVDSAYAAPAMAAVVPEARVVFVLRDPIARLVSSFQFHKSRLYLPGTLGLDAYVDLCLRYERGEITPAAAGMREWFLRVLDAGRYAAHLADFRVHLAPERMLVTSFDELNRDPKAYMLRVARWAGLDPGFYDAYVYERANVTFAPRRVWLQRIALGFNRLWEPFFNRYPDLKRRLLTLYKRLNGRAAEKPVMSPETRARLVAYYEPDVARLASEWGEGVAAAQTWLEKHRG